MAFNFSEEKIVSKQLLKKHETICSTRITVEEGEAIDKVLDSFATVLITAEERVQDNVQFGGKVDLSVLFETRSKQLSSANGSIDFVDTASVASAEWTFVCPEVKLIRVIKDSENTIEVTVTIENNFYGIKKEAIKPILPSNEGYFEKSREIVLGELACATADSFSLSEEIEINEIISQVVASYPLVSVSRVSSEENYVLVEGEVVREIVYLVGEHVRRYQKIDGFSQEVSMLGAKKGMPIDATLHVQSTDSSLEVFTEQNKSLLRSELNIKVNMFGFKEKQVTLLADIFSDKQKLYLATECVENTRFAEQKYFSDKIEYVFDSSKLKRIDEIVTVSNTRANVEQSVVEDGMMRVSGVITAQVVYKNYERDSYLSSEITVPFETETREAEGRVSEVLAVARCVSFKNKPGKEIALSFEIDMSARYDKQELECFLSDIEILPEEIKNDHAITIFYPGENQSVFDIAKELSISPDQLVAQNTELGEGKLPEKIVIYRQS